MRTPLHCTSTHNSSSCKHPLTTHTHTHTYRIYIKPSHCAENANVLTRCCFTFAPPTASQWLLIDALSFHCVQLSELYDDKQHALLLQKLNQPTSHPEGGEIPLPACITSSSGWQCSQLISVKPDEVCHASDVVSCWNTLII